MCHESSSWVSQLLLENHARKMASSSLKAHWSILYVIMIVGLVHPHALWVLASGARNNT